MVERPAGAAPVLMRSSAAFAPTTPSASFLGYPFPTSSSSVPSDRLPHGHPQPSLSGIVNEPRHALFAAVPGLRACDCVFEPPLFAHPRLYDSSRLYRSRTARAPAAFGSYPQWENEAGSIQTHGFPCRCLLHPPRPPMWTRSTPVARCPGSFRRQHLISSSNWTAGQPVCMLRGYDLGAEGAPIYTNHQAMTQRPSLYRSMPDLRVCGERYDAPRSLPPEEDERHF